MAVAAYMDEPVTEDNPAPCEWSCIETCARMNAYDRVLAEFERDGRVGRTLGFPDIRRAAEFYELVRADVHSVTLSLPVEKFHVPVAVDVVLLDVDRDDWRAWHRERCGGCILCRVS